MKKNKFTLVVGPALLALVVILAFSSCGGGPGGNIETAPFTISGAITPASPVGGVDTSPKPFSAVVQTNTPIQLSVRAAGPSRAVSPEEVVSYPIEGKLKDGSLIFLLTGVYEPVNKTFTLQAASSMIIFQMDGKLTAGYAIDTSNTTQTVRVNTGGNNWETVDCTLGSGSGEIAETVTEVEPAGMPESLWGKWRACNPDGIPDPDGVYLLVSKYNVSTYDPWQERLYASAIVGVSGSAFPFDVIVKSEFHSGKYLKFKVANTLNSFTSYEIAGEMMVSGDWDALVARFGSAYRFICPYYDKSNALSGHDDGKEVETVFDSYADANVADGIKWAEETYFLAR